MTEYRLQDVITASNGIFYHMQLVDNVKYTELFEESNPLLLDTFLIVNHGEKFIAPLLEFYVEGGIITTQGLTDVSEIIFYNYYTNWYKLKTALTTQYDVLNPYTLTETESINVSRETSSTQTSVVNNSVYGYDSTDPINNDTSDNQGESTDKGTDITTRNKTTVGNVGNYSQSDLINKELSIARNNFITHVIGDISKLITLSIY